MHSGNLLYDADCGFCTASANWGVRRGIRAEVQPLHTADPRWGIDGERAKVEIPFRHDDGLVTWGAAAIADAMVTATGPLRWAGLLLRTRALQFVARPVYRLVAKYRHRLPGGTDQCALP